MNRGLGSVLVAIAYMASAFAQAPPPNRGHALLGRVRTADRQGVANAEVTIRWRTAPELPGLVGWSLSGQKVSGVAQSTVRTDESGRWRLDLPVAGPVEVQASSADGTLRSIRRFPVMAGAFVEQVLEPTFLLGGKVLDQNGDRAAHFKLRLEPLRSTWARMMCYGLPLDRGATTTDEAGRFAYPLTSAYLREPMWEPYLDIVPEDMAFFFARTPLLQPINDCRDLQLHVEPTPLHKGFVRDILGKGIAGAQVYWLLEPWRSVVSNDDGSFEIHARWASQLAASAPGYTPQRLPTNQAQKKLGEARLFELVPSRRLRVRMVDDAGDPLARHEVLWSFASGDEPPLERHAQSNERGELVLEDAPIGMTTMGFVKYRGTWCRFLHHVATKNLKLRDRVVSVRPVHGRVADAEGLPLAAARIVAVARKDGEPANPTTCMWVTYTDHGGNYRFPSLPPGPLRIMCEASTNGFASVDVPADGGEANLQTLATGVVKIRVVDEDTAPIAGAWVTLTVTGGIRKWLAPSPTPSQTTVVGFTDKDGNVGFRSLPPGGWQMFGHFVRDGVRLFANSKCQTGDVDLGLELRHPGR